MIKIENLSKKYGNKIVFNNRTIKIEEKITTIIMGKSGVGKTTFIKILMGLEKYDKGSISGMENKRISVVFQEDRLCENLSSILNILMVCNKEVTKEKVINELEKIGIEDDYYKPVKELSGGMKRRVAIIRSILAPSDIVIFDEPLKGLDIKTKNKVINYLKEVLKNKTAIVITHDINEAKKLGNKIINI